MCNTSIGVPMKSLHPISFTSWKDAPNRKEGRNIQCTTRCKKLYSRHPSNHVCTCCMYYTPNVARGMASAVLLFYFHQLMTLTKTRMHQ